MKLNALMRQIALLLALMMLLLSGAACAQEDLEKQYAAAKTMLENKDYQAAAEAFAALGDYSDSQRQWKRARYNIALELFDAEEYHEANAIFEELGDYQNSKKNAYTSFLRARIIDYKQAKTLYNEGDYEAAKALFESLGNYEDAKERAAQAEEKLQETLQAKAEVQFYENAVKLLDEGEYQAAYEAFLQAGPYEGATEGLYQAVEGMAKERVYARAEESLANGETAQALLMFETLDDFRDSTAQAETIRSAENAPEEMDENQRKYEQALLLRELWKREEANALFAELGDYSNAADLIEIIAPQIPAARLRDDYTTPYSEVFTAPDGSQHYYRIFKGVHTWVEAKFFCELLGGHLATITSNEENEFVYWFMRDNDFLTAYFGLSDEERVGNWIWVTGEPVEYTNWHLGEPSRSGKERYGMYFYKHTKGTWNDSHFYETYEWGEPGCSFICEWDVPAEK